MIPRAVYGAVEYCQESSILPSLDPPLPRPRPRPFQLRDRDASNAPGLRYEVEAADIIGISSRPWRRRMIRWGIRPASRLARRSDATLAMSASCQRRLGLNSCRIPHAKKRADAELQTFGV